MAQAKLTKQAIRFLIEKRDCEDQVFSYQEIAELIKQKFNISVSIPALHKSYSKNVAKFKSDNTAITHINVEDEISESKPTKVFERKESSFIKPTGFSEDSANNLSKTDLENLIK